MSEDVVYINVLPVKELLFRKCLEFIFVNLAGVIEYYLKAVFNVTPCCRYKCLP